MKLFTLMVAMCAVIHASWAGDEKQIKLEDIERESLIGETDPRGPEQKELTQQSTQHIQLSYSSDPQDVFVTPQPRGYSHQDSPAELRAQLYHLPKVHEAEQTYTVPAKQTLLQPIIGGSQPIQPALAPQPQYIYIQSPQHHHQQFMPQAHAYVMLPYASHYTPQHAPIHVQHNHHPVLPQPQLPTPAPQIYSYSHAPSHPHHQQSIQTIKSLEYSIPSAVTPLQTSVDYKTGSYPIVPKKSLPSIYTTSFQQYYSPGLEYHYSEAMPITKLSPHSSYSYQHTPTHSYHTNYVPQSPSYSYFHSGPSALTSSYNKHQSTGLLDSYVPSQVTYARQQHQQQAQYKSYYSTQPSYQQSHQYESPQIPQQLFTPASQPSSYAPYPTSQAYNTIQYSVSLPPYEHSKRSTSKATATLSVKAPKSN